MHTLLRTFVKKVGYVVAWIAAGFLSARNGQAAVLMYHAVDDSGWKHAISPKEFERQIATLRRTRIVVPLSDVVALAKGEKSLPPRAVAVTFDDGYADLVPTVLPILKRYRVPATLFLTTDVSEKTNSMGTPRVSREDIAELVQSGLVSIQAHGRTHPHLPRISEAEARAQMVDARTDIKGYLGEPPPYFAYPYGDRSPELEQMVEEVGYEAAFGITEGFVKKGSALFRLPRIQVDATMSPLLFALRLTPALSMNRHVVNRVRKMLPKRSKKITT